MEMSLHELNDFAKRLVAEFPVRSAPRAHVIGLKGELGAGKTTLVQMIAHELGIEGPVTSPTFAIVQVYPINRHPFERLIHVDAYRLDQSDPDTIGWAEYERDPENLIIVEWPENIRDFPPDAAVVALSVGEEGGRTVQYAKT